MMRLLRQLVFPLAAISQLRPAFTDYVTSMLETQQFVCNWLLALIEGGLILRYIWNRAYIYIYIYIYVFRRFIYWRLQNKNDIPRTVNHTVCRRWMPKEVGTAFESRIVEHTYMHCQFCVLLCSMWDQSASHPSRIYGFVLFNTVLLWFVHAAIWGCIKSREAIKQRKHDYTIYPIRITQADHLLCLVVNNLSVYQFVASVHDIVAGIIQGLFTATRDIVWSANARKVTLDDMGSADLFNTTKYFSTPCANARVVLNAPIVDSTIRPSDCYTEITS